MPFKVHVDCGYSLSYPLTMYFTRIPSPRNFSYGPASDIGFRWFRGGAQTLVFTADSHRWAEDEKVPDFLSEGRISFGLVDSAVTQDKPQPLGLDQSADGNFRLQLNGQDLLRSKGFGTGGEGGCSWVLNLEYHEGMSFYGLGGKTDPWNREADEQAFGTPMSGAIFHLNK